MSITDLFYKYNYFDKLSDYQKIIFDHVSNSTNTLDLHKVRMTMYQQHFTDVIYPEWLIDNDRTNFTTCTKEHITDTKHSLKELCKTSLNRKILIHNEYIDEDFDSNDNVRYYINSHGFRCEEFTDTECIAYIGCSHTFGTGVTQDEIWPELVSKGLNMRSANLGIPAVGLDYFNLYMNLFFKSEIQNCKAIVVMLPPSIRSSFFYNWQEGNGAIYGTGIGQLEWMDGLQHYSTEDLGNATRMSRHFEDSHKEVLEHKLMNIENCFDRDLVSINNIQKVADDLNIPCLIYSSYNFTNERIELNTPLDFARDCTHAGSKSHASMAQKIIKDLETIR